MTSHPEPILQRIQIEPTNRCNFLCIFCRRSHWQRSLGDMPLAQFREVLAQLPAIRHLHLQGQGEPLLNPDFAAMVYAGRNHGMTVGTSTNASLMTEEMSTRILGSGINRINLSLDTVDAQLFKKLRPGLPLGTILDNIARLSQIRATGRYEAALAIAVVAQQSTIPTLPGVVKIASDMGLDEVYVQNLNGGFLPTSLQQSSSCLSGENPLPPEPLREAQAIAAHSGIKLYLPPARPRQAHTCAWPFKGCNITWDGFVTPCCLQPDPDILNFGNVFETSFSTLWQSNSYRIFRQETQSRGAKICHSCPDLMGQMWHPETAPF